MVPTYCSRGNKVHEQGYGEQRQTPTWDLVFNLLSHCLEALGGLDATTGEVVEKSAHCRDNTKGMKMYGTVRY